MGARKKKLDTVVKLGLGVFIGSFAAFVVVPFGVGLIASDLNIGVYYVMAVTSVVTIGVLTRTSELIVMRACGVSLYRTALPLVLFSLVWSGALWGALPVACP